MNLVVISVLSSVVLLAGCTQNESRRAQQSPAAPAAAGPDMPMPPAAPAKATAPDVSVADGDFRVEDGRSAPPTPDTREETAPPVVAVPPVPPVRVEDPSTMTSPTGVTTPPAADLRLQPARPVELTDASPDFPADMPRPVPAATAATARPAGVTGATATTGEFRPVPAPSVDDEVETEAAPATPVEQRRGQEQRFRPMPRQDETAPTGPARAETVTEPRTAATGVRADGPATTTVVVVAATGVTGATGPAGRDTRAAVAAPTSATRAESPSKFEIKDYKVAESKAYTAYLKPMLQKIRGMNSVTADRLEKRILELKLQTYNAADADVWEHFRGEVLVAGFKLPEQTEFRLIQLKGGALIPAREMAADEAAARWILETALFRLAFDATDKKDMNFMATVTGLAHSISDSFMKSRDRLKKRLVYEYLRYAQIPVDEWKFEQLDAIAASSAILRLSLRQYTVSMAQPPEAFDVKPLDLTDPRAENCRVHITYHGIEKGVLVQVSEPQWREFEFTFDVQSQEQYPLRPSLAGDDFLDLEIIKKQADKTSLRLTVRYKVQPAGTEDERVADHMVLEKLPEKGKAEKILMCRIVPWPDIPPRAREDKPAGETAVTGATATTGPVRGQEQRFRPMPAATGVTTGTTAATGAKTGTTATTAPVRGQEQRFRPMPTATGVTAATGVKTGTTAATGPVRGQEQRFRPMPAATGVTTAKAVTAATGVKTGTTAATGVTGPSGQKTR